MRRARLASVPASTVAVDAVRAELAALGVSETDLLAVEALVVAGHLDAATGAATGPLVRLLRELVSELRVAAGRGPVGPVDELLARQQRRPRGEGSG